MYRKMNWLTSNGSSMGLWSDDVQSETSAQEWHLLPTDEEFTARGSGRQDED